MPNLDCMKLSIIDFTWSIVKRGLKGFPSIVIFSSSPLLKASSQTKTTYSFRKRHASLYSSSVTGSIPLTSKLSFISFFDDSLRMYSKLYFLVFSLIKRKNQTKRRLKNL